MTKKSDLKAEIGEVSQAKKAFKSTETHKNLGLQSLDSVHVKFREKICENCNGNRTQPYDRAWETLSDWLRNPAVVKNRQRSIRANKVFTLNATSMLLRVHLFFVKLFGCHIKEQDIAIDLASFSRALIDGTAHQNVFLAFGLCSDHWFKGKAGGGDLDGVLDESKSLVTLSWSYFVGRLVVHVYYVSDFSKIDPHAELWHPHFGTNRLKLLHVK